MMGDKVGYLRHMMLHQENVFGLDYGKCSFELSISKARRGASSEAAGMNSPRRRSLATLFMISLPERHNPSQCSTLVVALDPYECNSCHIYISLSIQY